MLDGGPFSDLERSRSKKCDGVRRGSRTTLLGLGPRISAPDDDSLYPRELETGRFCSKRSLSLKNHKTRPRGLRDWASGICFGFTSGRLGYWATIRNIRYCDIYRRRRVPLAEIYLPMPGNFRITRAEEIEEPSIEVTSTPEGVEGGVIAVLHNHQNMVLTKVGVARMRISRPVSQSRVVWQRTSGMACIRPPDVKSFWYRMR